MTGANAVVSGAIRTAGGAALRFPPTGVRRETPREAGDRR